MTRQEGGGTKKVIFNDKGERGGLEPSLKYDDIINEQPLRKVYAIYMKPNTMIDNVMI